jgi:hypothetical protein
MGSRPDPATFGTGADCGCVTVSGIGCAGGTASWPVTLRPRRGGASGRGSRFTSVLHETTLRRANRIAERMSTTPSRAERIWQSRMLFGHGTGREGNWLLSCGVSRSRGLAVSEPANLRYGTQFMRPPHRETARPSNRETARTPTAFASFGASLSSSSVPALARARALRAMFVREGLDRSRRGRAS